jgi:hypothetical protein
MQLMNALVAATVIASPAVAADFELICQNPGREYFITYDAGAKVAVINPDSTATRQTVIAVIENDGERLVVLDLGEPGMASVLHLRPYMKNDIYADGELVQTDACRPA